MTDIIVIAIVAIILGLAIGYIVRAKKRGTKCIGCPEGTCGGCNGSCSCHADAE